MLTVKTVLISLFVVFMLPGVSFGQARKVVTGDVLVYETASAKQMGNQSVEFPASGHRVVNVSIENDGTRNYISATNGKHVSTRDKLYIRSAIGDRPR